MDGVSKDDTNDLINDITFANVGKMSAGKQLVLGSVSGWCTGFIGTKVGKVAAIAIGGGIILMQVANYNGYIKINWNKINKKIDKISDTVEGTVTNKGLRWIDKVTKFASDNSYLSTGFIGGLLIGIACS